MCAPRRRGCRTAAGRRTTAELPRLLKGDAPVNVNADRLSYAGCRWRGDLHRQRLALWQGSDTSIRADELRLDQSKGDLTASGSARVRC